MNLAHAFALLMLAASSAIAHPSLTPRLLDAIRQVESSGNDRLIGDGGKAIGPYQIHKSYWQDAVEHDPSIGGSYEDCFDRKYAERIMHAYMDRYAPRNATAEQISRIHNGGPNALKAKPGSRLKAALDKYWRKVRDAMR